MNEIDRNFKKFQTIIETLTEEEIFTNIMDNFQKVNPNTQKSIEEYFKKFPYWGQLDLENKNFEHQKEKAKSLKKNINNYQWLYDHLNDYRSKKLLLALLQNFYYYDFKTLSETIEHTYKHYFDLDLVTVDQNEVIVDLGAYTGDTIEEYFQTYGENNYQKIYCYEITPSTIAKLKEKWSNTPNIICRKKAISDCETTMYIGNNPNDPSANIITDSGTEPIETVTLDNDIKDKITLIKMDIEGSEQKAIKGAYNHITNDHPKLLISVYHNNEDVWKIPQMIYEINPNYNFYLRNHGGPIYPTEITLLAIPKQI